jgi:hypothetical protein
MKIIIPDDYFEDTALHGREIEIPELLKTHPAEVLLALIKGGQRNIAQAIDDPNGRLQSLLSLDLTQALQIAIRELRILRKVSMEKKSQR